ncbi:G2/mitotic-specific cyclin [Blastocystis sp. ATCC 50177/Nand II]|uniref:G2/mitotic-specific cyclin n=1 Tax=Blastocystis sp. subtype 1 (strain ATCC 50177 / NandII) TaxID=478820 RepID=A0A196SBY0_BLAHN|nr:G2/mitotic-specific cyclin [Blastocystis sp. ATCC 50177/Nand II]
MEMNSTVQAERGVFKRAQRSNDLGNENLVKKPALVNPLQEVNNAPSAGISKAPTESVKPSNPLVREPSMQEIVDEHDRDDQLMFSPYAQRIVNNWLKVEEKFHVSPNYLDGQTDIKPYMRETLIDWIMEVNQHFHHRRETLYLCTNIVDRYVAAVIRDKSEVISRSNYQLVGVTAYLIASKYEEIYYPEIRVILDFADGIYTEDEVKRMEVKIVNTLKYDLTVPTTNKFLGRFLRLSSNKNIHFMCYFICDRMLQSLSMLNWKPSNKTFEDFTGVKKSTLMPCAIAIHNIIMTPSQLHACEKKYKSSRFNQIYNSIPQKGRQ